MVRPFAEKLGLFTLKTRIALATSLIFIVFVGALAMLTITYFVREYRGSIGAQQFQLLSAIARSVDTQLDGARGALSRVAAEVPPEAFQDAAVARAFLNGRFVLRGRIFGVNLALIDNAGRVIAEVLPSAYVNSARSW